MTTTLTLGERIVALAAADNADPVSALERRATQAGGEQLEQFHAVVRFFEQTKANITEDVMANRPIRKMTIGQLGDHTEGLQSYLGVLYWDNKDRTVAHRSHTYFAVWDRFAQWAKSEKLALAWHARHDGGGVESWWELEVVPNV